MRAHLLFKLNAKKGEWRSCKKNNPSGILGGIFGGNNPWLHKGFDSVPSECQQSALGGAVVCLLEGRGE